MTLFALQSDDIITEVKPKKVKPKSYSLISVSDNSIILDKVEKYVLKKWVRKNTSIFYINKYRWMSELMSYGNYKITKNY